MSPLIARPPFTVNIPSIVVSPYISTLLLKYAISSNVAVAPSLTTILLSKFTVFVNNVGASTKN
jgi:hypothetical protein